jgi:hypothetical protein
MPPGRIHKVDIPFYIWYNSIRKVVESMKSWKVVFKYVYNIEVEADTELEAYLIAEDIMLKREENGDLGGPDTFEEEITANE